MNMKTSLKLLALVWLTNLAATIQAQPVLSLDFADRTSAAALEAGFTPFLIESNTSATAIQTVASVRNIGGLTVTVSGGGGNPGYDDRQRTTPTNSGAFTQELLLRDFIFATNQASGGGLDVQIDGLTPNQVYSVSLWSYDSGTSGNRLSDWYAQGRKMVTNYTFSGSTTVMPTNNAQYQMNFRALAGTDGRLLIQGRRVSGALAVFLNALQLTPTNGEPPTIASQPAPVEIYAGDNAVFRVTAAGLPPLAYQWRKADVDILGATNGTFVLTNAQAADAADYTCFVTNLLGFGSITSAPAALTVLPVADIRTARVAWWPLDEITGGLTPDATPNQFHLFASNITSADVIAGPRDGALRFNGVNAFVMRNDALGGVPLNQSPAYTVALWVKGQGTNQLDRRVFAVSSSVNNNPMITVGTGNPVGTNAVDIYIRNNDGTAPMNHLKSSLPVFDDTWHHLAWVDNNGFGRIYVDGVADTNAFNYTRGTLTPNVTSLGVVYRTNAAALFTGAIDDAAVWRRALTPAEIQFVMTNGPEVLPYIKTQPVSRVANPGSDVSFTVSFQSPTPATGQWFLNATNALPDATDPTFTLTHVSSANAGAYTLVLSNAAGVVTSAVATLTINRSPFAANVNTGAAQDTPALYPEALFLQACSDPDLDLLVLALVSYASTQGGTVSLADGVVTYVPAAGFTGTDDFTYVVTDMHRGLASAQVFVTVVSTNQPDFQRLTAPALTPTNTIALRFSGVPFASGVLRRSTNLTDWTDLLTNLAPATGLFEFIDPAPPTNQAFYRVRLP